MMYLVNKTRNSVKLLNSYSAISLKRMKSSLISEFSSSEVELWKINGVGQILLNRPKQLNALNYTMVKQMQKQLEYCENDKDIRCVLIKGQGETAFCAGGDVKSIREDCVSGNRKRAMEFFAEEYKLNYQIANCKKPYVALINGITMGGGVGVSIHGRYRVAGEKTVFAMPETLIGFFADVGGTYFLSRLDDSLGIYLVLTGHRLKGADVKHAGIATHYAGSAAKIADIEAELQATSDLNDEKVQAILSKHSEQLDPASFNLDRSKVSRIFSSQSLAQIIESLEKDGSDWAKNQLKSLSKMSPTSLKVAIKQLHLGKSLSLKECLELEYRLCLRFTSSSDFMEGVRALLVDKDMKPNWMPKKHEDVDETIINWYFQEQTGEDKLILKSSSAPKL